MSASCDLYVQPLDRDMRPQGPRRQLTRAKFWARGVTWTPDGRSIVYGVWSGQPHLWRVRADGSGSPERVELAGPGAIGPRAGRSRDRLVFTRFVLDLHISQLRPGASPTPLIQSTMTDFQPQYSPDGRRVAFTSERAEERAEVWLADADGTNATRLTRGPGKSQGTPSWSPDGRTIAFNSVGFDGHVDIWTIGVDGSGLRRMTRDPGDEHSASFSRDGRLLYYVSARTGRGEIWRVSVAGGAEEQVTREGGVLPFESADGQTLYYVRNEGFSDGQLLARPTRGGAERVLVPCVPNAAYAVGPPGLFHVGCATAKKEGVDRRSVWLRDASGRAREIATLELLPGTGFLGLSAAPDGSSIVYATGSYTTTAMMIENFR